MCSIQGGAMKISSVKKTSAFYKKIERLRGNLNSECLTYNNSTFRIANENSNFDAASKLSSCNASSYNNDLINNSLIKSEKIVISIDNTKFENGNDLISHQSTEKTAVQIKFSNEMKNDKTCSLNKEDSKTRIKNDDDVTEDTFKLEFDENEIIENDKLCKLSEKNKNGKGKGVKDLSTVKINKKNRKKQLKLVNPNSRAQELYKYDLIKKSNEYAWVHVSCALWNPFVQINDFENKEDIKSKYFFIIIILLIMKFIFNKDIETIDIIRFNEKCSICLKTGYGPCMKCDNDKCHVYFHVECARINKYHMECIFADEGMKYFLYCQTHRPLQFLKTLEIKNNKKKEDIMKFAELVERSLENITKGILITKPYALEKCSANNLKYLNKKRNKLCQTDINEIPDLSKNQLNKVISRIKDVYHKISHLDVIVKFKEKAKKYEVLKEFTNFISFKDTFDKNIFPWYLINIPGIPIKLSYVNYGRICNNNTEFNKLILSKNNDKNNSSVNVAVNTTSLYCYCKNKYDESFMVACSNESNCKYNGWFHPFCVEELKKYTKEEVEDDNFVFTCKSCLKQLNAEEESKVDYYSKQFKKTTRTSRRKLSELNNESNTNTKINQETVTLSLAEDSNNKFNNKNNEIKNSSLIPPFEISLTENPILTNYEVNINKFNQEKKLHEYKNEKSIKNNELELQESSSISNNMKTSSEYEKYTPESTLSKNIKKGGLINFITNYEIEKIEEENK